MQVQPWFKEWFESKYYHILYKYRDDKEAKRFLDNLLLALEMKPEKEVMDVACGKGRHALYLNQLGYKVTGIDLSKSSIDQARDFENDKLKFINTDMRQIDFKGQFDLVLNLFTSFGYFKDEADDLLVLKRIRNSLKPDGVIVLDYLNVLSIKSFEEERNYIVEGISFFTKKYVKGDFIVKEIEVNDEGKTFYFEERVRYISHSMFSEMFNRTNLRVLDVFGDYELAKFDEERSSRLIFILIGA